MEREKQIIRQGDAVHFSSEIASAHGYASSKGRGEMTGLVAVWIYPGSPNFGEYKDWTGIEYFLPDQLEVTCPYGGTPGKVLA